MKNILFWLELHNRPQSEFSAPFRMDTEYLNIKAEIENLTSEVYNKLDTKQLSYFKINSDTVNYNFYDVREGDEN